MRLPWTSIGLLLLAGCGETAPEGPVDALAAGWVARIDLSKEPEPGRFVLEDGRLEATQGRNATLWHPDHRPGGSFRLAATVTHLDSGLHPHGAGLVFGGTDVEGRDQRYTYFLVRNDRRFLIKTRAGSETADVVPWTEHEAAAPEGADFVTHNELAVEVDGAETRFLINGEVVHTADTATLPTAGRCGFRLVHDIHVRFGPLELGEPRR